MTEKGIIKFFQEQSRYIKSVGAFYPPQEIYEILFKMIEELQQYREIGTVEECREARERQRAKKPSQGEPYTWISSVRIKGRYRDVRKTSYHHVCPNCGENVAMDMSCCKYCGQSIDWSDTP